MPSGFHTSFPRSSMSGEGAFGSSVPYTCLAGVQTNACNCPQLLWQQIVDCTRTAGRSYCVHIVQKGEDALPWPQTNLTVRQRIVDCKAEQQRHQRIPLFAVFCLVDLMLHTITILPHVARGSDVGRSNEWQETSEAWDTMLVDSANWNGEQTDSTVFPNCLAKVFAINLRKLVPVAIPRAPPSFTDSQHLVCAPSWSWGGPRRSTGQTLTEQICIEVERSFRCATRTTGGISLTCSCNSLNVSAVFGARAAPVNSCLALDTWPRSTRLCAARPRRAFSRVWSCGLLPARTGTWFCASSNNSNH